MELFKIFGTLALSGQDQFNSGLDKASSAGEKLSKAVGKGLATAAKVGAAAVTAASAAVGVLLKQSIANYAEYEQLVGGAQLMFGEAYSTVAENAANAYATVQMSQNEYLQQVNGFATGLKTALGGNEQAAAELAHRIIEAEADIVAATGNSQENVQNAFNGIMKSNYTMLDNLQLGITPTKEGFQEVIDKVNAWNKANGKATKYQIENLADCQAALVDYVAMQGLAGYAANEAAGTISGSLAMTKAAWSNLLTAFADENADMSETTRAFMESAAIAAKNIVPRIGKAFKGIIKAMPEIIRQAKEQLFEAFPALEEKLIAIEQWIEKYKGVLAAVAVAIGVVTAAIGLYSAVAAIKLAMDAAQVTTLGGLITAKLASAAATMAAVAPYVLIVAAIAAVIAIIVLCVKHWDTIKAKVIEVAESISAKVQEIKDNVTQKFEELKANAIEKWEALKTSAVEKWEALKTSVAEKVEALKTTVGLKFLAIKNAALTKWQELTGGITEKIEAAKTTVKDVIDAIKGFFDFEFSWPNIPMPHFAIDPAGWKIGDLLNGVIPSLGIDWYAKAMDNPMLLTKPSIFGYDSQTGNFLGGGEAGAEVVSGASTLMNMISSAVGSQNDRVVSVLVAILEALKDGGGNGQGVVIDLTTTLDGAVLARKLYKHNQTVNNDRGLSFVRG